MISPASLIFRFLDLIETARSSSALIMYKLVDFFINLLAQMISSPVVRMVMVTSMITSYALTCKVSHFSGVSSVLHVLAHLSIAS